VNSSILDEKAPKTLRFSYSSELRIPRDYRFLFTRCHAPNYRFLVLTNALTILLKKILHTIYMPYLKKC